MKSLRAAVVSVLASFAAVAAGFACSTPSSSERFVEKVPDRASFDPVALAMVHQCGTLDCHGVQARNLRLYGNEGLRLSSKDRPSFNHFDGGVPVVEATSTTAAEIDEDYLSVVGLEPESMTAVMNDRGGVPNRLTLIRKARGEEQHKGLAIVKLGDDWDVCVTSWLAGATDAAACYKAAQKK